MFSHPIIYKLKKSIRSKYFIIIFFLTLADLISKILALFFLPFGQDICLIDNTFGFFLGYNTESTGGQVDYLLQDDPNKNFSIIISSVFYILLTIGIFIIEKFQIKRIYKLVIEVISGALLVVLIGLIGSNFQQYQISNWWTSVISKIAAIVFYSGLFVLIRNKQIRFFLVIILSAGIGNLLSHFYYPYSIIDFIYIEGSYELLRIGEFNLADLFFDIGIVGLIIAIIINLVKGGYKYIVKWYSKRLLTLLILCIQCLTSCVNINENNVMSSSGRCSKVSPGSLSN